MDKTQGILQGLGNAGTTMAFVPVALRKRNKVSNASSSIIRRSSPTFDASTNKNEGGKEVKEKSSFVYSTTTVARTLKSEQKKENSIKVIQEKKIPMKTSTIAEQNSEEEKEEEIKDPYNPRQPNDYLQYRQQKKAERQQQKLIQQTKETLKIQQELRQKLKKERDEMDATGDVSKMISIREKQGLGRGRGRGVSNLPAWILQKQQEDSLGQNES